MGEVLPMPEVDQAWRALARGIDPRLACAVGAVVFVLATSARAEPRSLRDVVYDYAVAGFCGLLSPEVELGFQREKTHLTERDALSPESARAARIAGWLAADLEWGNRGLGGFRAWCETEGVDAAHRFRAIAGDRAPP